MIAFVRDLRGRIWGTDDPEVVRVLVSALIDRLEQEKDDFELLRLLVELGDEVGVDVERPEEQDGPDV